MRTHMLLLTLLVACSESKVIGIADETIDTQSTGDTGDTVEPGDSTDTEEDLSQWDGAILVIDQPLSGDFVPYGEDTNFVATVYSADGDAMDFTDITWTSDLDSGWGLTGDDLTDDSLEVGEHAITAEAVLPNGDRLRSTMGGVLVQDEDAGIYVGDVRVNVILSWDGVDYTAGCIGAVTITVDAYGEAATGDSACVVSLLGFEQDLSYDFDLTVDNGTIGGGAVVDLLFFTLDFDVDGAVSNGEMSGEWVSSDVVELDGTLSATRITRSLE